MRTFLVTFHKTVSDDTGHEHRVLQRRIPVRAATEIAALGEAKTKFCQAMGVADWRFRADECVAAEVPAAI